MEAFLSLFSLLIVIVFIWIIWQLVSRMIAWVLQPAVDYFDEKEERDSERTRIILGRIDAIGMHGSDDLSLNSTDNENRFLCPQCGVSVDTGQLESFINGESTEIRCPLCSSEVVYTMYEVGAVRDHRGFRLLK